MGHIFEAEKVNQKPIYTKAGFACEVECDKAYTVCANEGCGTKAIFHYPTTILLKSKDKSETLLRVHFPLCEKCSKVFLKDAF